MKTLIVLFVDNKPKGILTEKQFENHTGKKWWHTAETISVPQEDWDKDKVRIDTIRKYLF